MAAPATRRGIREEARFYYTEGTTKSHLRVLRSSCGGKWECDPRIPQSTFLGSDPGPALALACATSEIELRVCTPTYPLIFCSCWTCRLVLVRRLFSSVSLREQRDKTLARWAMAKSAFCLDVIVQKEFLFWRYT